MTLGAPLNASNVKEGEDVYFECSVHARPDAEQVEWLLNVSALTFWSTRPSQGR